jgi:hypothetical protein
MSAQDEDDPVSCPSPFTADNSEIRGSVGSKAVLDEAAKLLQITQYFQPIRNLLK